MDKLMCLSFNKEIPMSYVRPSVLVYQDLLNGGGVLNATPDLEACIIGPTYNSLSYVPGSVISQVKTAAYSTTSTTGSIEVGSVALTVASTGGFAVSDSLLIIGAGSDGATLQANIVNISGNVITLDSAAKTALTVDAPGTVTKTGKIANSTISNTFNLPGQKPGQVIDAASIKPWLNNTKVETLATGVEVFYTDNTLTVRSISTTGSITTGTSSLVVATSAGLVKGDTITVAGAGAAGATLTARITDIAGNTLTVTPAAGTTANTQAVNKVMPANLNSTTNTLRVEPGDLVSISYTDNTAVARTVTSQVTKVTTSSGQNGTISDIDVADMFPSNISYQTTGGITTGTTALTVAVATGIVIGGKVLVRGAAAGGVDLIAGVTNVAGLNITLDTQAGTTVAGAQVIAYNRTVAISVRKTYNNQQLPATKPISGGSNFDTANAGTLGQVTINVGVELVYGPVVSGDVYFGYKALRTDLCNRVLTINDTLDLQGQLGDVSDDNPLALGVQIALANTTGRIRAICIPSNDLLGYQNALEYAEGERLYFLAPLTQDPSILAAFKAHVVQLSTPENASWRVAIVNTAIPTSQNIGQYSSTYVNANSGNNAVTLVNGNYVLTASNATFLADGVAPGDVVYFSAATPAGQVGAHQVLQVVSNQQLVIQTTVTSTAVSYYVTRTMSKTQSAQSVKATSEVFASNRVWHIQPDIVGVSVNGVTKYLPGYYLCCGLAGMGAGFPVQQGFTNIGVAGISDLKNSNFTFSKADMNTMAEGGTCLFVQETQGGIPYVRHEMTTDVTVLEYREQLVVKNWDFLSYFYYDKLKGFIGSWNITSDTMNTIRQSIIASSELVKAKKLPKIGAPLMGYKINRLEQNAYNKDNLDVELQISVVYPLNYLNLHLVI